MNEITQCIFYKNPKLNNCKKCTLEYICYKCLELENHAHMHAHEARARTRARRKKPENNIKNS